MAELIHEIQPESSQEKAVQYRPSVYLDVSKEQLDVLEVGKNVTIQLMGKVTQLRASDSDSEDNRYEISLDLKEVVIDPEDNAFADLAEDD